MIIRQTRKHFRVVADESVASLVSKYLRESKSDNVAIENLGGQNFLLFSTKLFKGESQIEKFVNVVTGRKVQKESDGVATKASDVSDAELALINKHALKALKKEDVSVYTMKAANNRVDRDMERFSDEVIDSFAKSIVGKSWLYMHNKYDFMPFGKVFEAWTAVESGVKWLYIKGYVLNTDEDLVKKIDSGIWKFVSIGFTAPGYMAISDASGKITHFEYRNVNGKEAEGLEISLVWLGAQYDAEVSKDPDNALVVMKEARQLLSADQINKCTTLDEIRNAIEQKKSQSPQKTKGVRSMKHLMKILGLDKVIEVGENATDDQLMAAVQSVVDKTVDEVMAPLKAENAALKDAAAKNKSAIDGFKEALVNEVATLINSVTKFVDDAERAAEVTRLKSLDIDALSAEKESWKAKAAKRAQTPDGTPQTEPGDKDKAAVIANVNGVQQFV
jgi:hypothetical protein